MFVSDMQQQKAAARHMLPAGQRQLQGLPHLSSKTNPLRISEEIR